ncbi:MAG: DNA-3-methyladenine glycosylase, partial [Pyrinomonadaceae bacterium]
MKIKREFYLRKNTVRIARELLGKLLVVPNDRGERISAMIVETEAYLGVDDRAAHSYGGRRTKRTETMYSAGGCVYIFFIYGMYYQFNIVTGPEHQPHAILIRAVEPVEGIEIMRERRGEMKDHNLTSGPGKLCIAMGIDRDVNGAD